MARDMSPEAILLRVERGLADYADVQALRQALGLPSQQPLWAYPLGEADGWVE
jgi:hypothetical protein